MSNTVRIALVAEGITDYLVLKAAISSMLGNRSFNVKLLQPEESVAFIGAGDAGPLGGGWRGVYKWCLQAAKRGGGRVSDDPIFQTYDVLVLHLDADVASEDPANHKQNPIKALNGVLPCELPCPEPRHTTNALRTILLSWLGESESPPKTVLCTPSKAIEAWVVAIFFPKDPEMTKKGWECHPNPANRLGQQRKKHRFRKSQTDYQDRESAIQTGWHRVVSRLSEAKRFNDDFIAETPADTVS
jgi:hypothetical protein